MFSRVWVARATQQGAADYVTFFKSYWLPKLPSFTGYRGAIAQTRIVNNLVEIMLTTFWDSLEASLAFGSAGNEDGARVPEEAARCLIDYDSFVVHHEIVVDCFSAQHHQ